MSCLQKSAGILLKMPSHPAWTFAVNLWERISCRSELMECTPYWASLTPTLKTFRKIAQSTSSASFSLLIVLTIGFHFVIFVYTSSFYMMVRHPGSQFGVVVVKNIRLETWTPWVILTARWLFTTHIFSALGSRQCQITSEILILTGKPQRLIQPNPNQESETDWKEMGVGGIIWSVGMYMK